MAKARDFVSEGVNLVKSGISAKAAAQLITDRENGDWNVNAFRQAIGKKVKSKNSEVKSKTIEKEKPSAFVLDTDAYITPKNEPMEDPKPLELSAWHPKTGLMMGIEEYCHYYNLPFEHIVSYKLITHTGTPYYNTLFKEIVKVAGRLSEDFIEATIQRYIRPIEIRKPHIMSYDLKWFDVLTYTDTHIGMCTDKEGVAMYATPWNREEQMRRVDLMCDEVLINQKGTELHVNELGDFMDGWDGLTTRGGHLLPQNMSNEEAFDIGVAFKMRIIDRLVGHYDKIHLHNICNDNHAGAFGYVVNSAVKSIAEAKYGTKQVAIELQRQFINYYLVGKHAFVTTHGKDSKSLKFGFKPKLDAVQIEKIDAFLKHNRIYHQAEFIEFAKGDSHQMLLDFCSSDDFDYFNYPAFSPASEWVQTNFKKSRSGFVLQNVMYNENVKILKPIWFN